MAKKVLSAMTSIPTIDDQSPDWMLKEFLLEKDPNYHKFLELKKKVTVPSEDTDLVADSH